MKKDKLLALAAVAGGALLYAGRNQVVNLADKAVAAGQAALFGATLPSPLSNYAALIIDVANSRNVSPWLIAGIVWRESNGGAALTPADETGTGDFTARDPKRWTMAAPNGLPPDGKGWGRGLGQIDYGVHLAWVNANAWWDARVNLTKAADILQGFLRAFSSRVNLDGRYTDGTTVAIGGTPAARKLGLQDGQTFPDPRPLTGAALNDAALAAYNAGALQVLQAIASGHRGEEVTTGGQYSSWVASRIATWSSKFV